MQEIMFLDEQDNLINAMIGEFISKIYFKMT